MYEVVLTSSKDGTIIAYDASSGNPVGQYNGSRTPCRGLTVTADHELIVASHVFPDKGTGSIHIYNWYNSSIFDIIPLPEPVAPITTTLDSAFLIAGGVSGTLYSLSLLSGDLIGSFHFHSKAVSALHIIGDGSLVFSGSDDGMVVMIPTFKLVDASPSSCDVKDLILHEWKAHSDSVTAFSTGIGLCSSKLVSCSVDCTCKFWSFSDDVILMRTVTFPCAIFGFVMDSTELGFYAGGADGFVYKGLIKVGTKKIVSKGYKLIRWGKINGKKLHNASIVSLGLVNEGRNLVSAGEDGCVWMWDVEEGEAIALENDYRGSVSDMMVVKGNAYWPGGVTKGNNGGEVSGFSSSMLFDEELFKTLKQITDLGDVMDVAANDKRRAINMLESAIEMYEQLLRLIRKEAIKAIEEGEEDNNYNGKQ